MTNTDPKNLLPMADDSCSCCGTDVADTSSETSSNASGGVQATYGVAGMTCSHCASSVAAEVLKLPGVLDVQVDVTAGRVAVTSQTPIAPESFAAAIDEAGYEVVTA